MVSVERMGKKERERFLELFEIGIKRSMELAEKIKKDRDLKYNVGGFKIPDFFPDGYGDYCSLVYPKFLRLKALCLSLREQEITDLELFSREGGNLGQVFEMVNQIPDLINYLRYWWAHLMALKEMEKTSKEEVGPELKEEGD